MKDVILIVEDETNIRANIAEFLQAEDFETLLAKDGEEAIAILMKKTGFGNFGFDAALKLTGWKYANIFAVIQMCLLLW